MIKFHLDTEFSGHGGWLISLALAVDASDYLYLVRTQDEIETLDDLEPMDPWVRENVMPILRDVPEGAAITEAPIAEWGQIISEFIYARNHYAQIIADWPEDLRYLMELLVTGPGTAVPMDDKTHFTIIRHVDIYPTKIEGAVQHNALWDALAIRRFLME